MKRKRALPGSNIPGIDRATDKNVNQWVVSFLRSPLIFFEVNYASKNPPNDISQAEIQEIITRINIQTKSLTIFAPAR